MKEQNKKILVVDDDPDIVEFITYNLQKEGFETLSANNGETAIQVAIEQKPDLLILDVMMPGMDGMEVCQVLREMPDFQKTYIVFLSARAEDFSQLAGFAVGADDYIVKPVKPKILIARIKALMKRMLIDDAPGKFIYTKNLTIDIERHQVRMDNKNIDFPKKEFELLSLLASKPGRVFTREEIYIRLWGEEIIVSERTLDVYIRKIREKIGEQLIRTVKGVGYKLE